MEAVDIHELLKAALLHQIINRPMYLLFALAYLLCMFVVLITDTFRVQVAVKYILRW